MIALFKSKPIRVPASRRGGKPVRAYVRLDPRAFTKHERTMVDRDYPVIEKMAYASVVSQLAKGKHLTFPQDAILDAADAGVRAYLDHHKNPDWRKLVQQRIAGAVKDHARWESSHGVTGHTHALRLYMQADPEERERLRTMLPRFQDDEAMHALRAPSAEEMVEELRSREEMVERVQKQYGVNVDKVRELLSARTVTPRGRAQLDVDRALRVFELSTQGLSKRAIAAKLGMSPTAVTTAKAFVTKLMREVARIEKLEAPEPSQTVEDKLTKSLRLNDVQQDRLYRAFARHQRAVTMGYPADFVTDNRWLLTELILDAGHQLRE